MLDRAGLFVVMVTAACGQVGAKSGGSHADAPDEVDAATDSPVDAAVAVDRNCTDVKARLGTATDGAYLIDPDLDGTTYQPFRVFCMHMDSASPVEYLELVHTSRPSDTATSNYSAFASGAPHGNWTCDCGVITTVFSKVRIDPMSLVITTDSTFGVFADSTQQSCLATKPGCPGVMPYTAAGSCVGNFDASGRANIDLRGTGFHVAGTDSAEFKRYEDFSPNLGFTSAGAATIDAARQIVDVSGGGDCGGFGALDGVTLVQD